MSKTSYVLQGRALRNRYRRGQFICRPKCVSKGSHGAINWPKYRTQRSWRYGPHFLSFYFFCVGEPPLCACEPVYSPTQPTFRNLNSLEGRPFGLPSLSPPWRASTPDVSEKVLLFRTGSPHRSFSSCRDVRFPRRSINTFQLLEMSTETNRSLPGSGPQNYLIYKDNSHLKVFLFLCLRTKR